MNDNHSRLSESVKKHSPVTRVFYVFRKSRNIRAHGSRYPPWKTIWYSFNRNSETTLMRRHFDFHDYQLGCVRVTRFFMLTCTHGKVDFLNFIFATHLNKYTLNYTQNQNCLFIHLVRSWLTFTAISTFPFAQKTHNWKLECSPY